MLIAGVDVGGTNTEAALVNDKHRVVARSKKPTPKEGPDAVIDTIRELIDSLKKKPGAVGVGIPGAVNGGKVITVPNLPHWSAGIDLGKRLRTSLGLPVALGNDANVGLLGEWLAGAAKGADNVLGVWMGTGIGGGLILDGRPYTGSRGAAGEVGHVIVRADGALCSCGRRGCVEAYAGRHLMSATVRAIYQSGRKTSLFKIQKAEGKPQPTSKVWARALKEGDTLAQEVFATGINTLGLGIASILNVLDLERVILGGGMADRMGQALADRVGKATRPWVMAPNPALKFVAARLGDDSGVVGAAALGRALISAA